MDTTDDDQPIGGEAPDVDGMLQDDRLSPSGSLFAPKMLQDIRCRLSFIAASECDCGTSPHENALHDLAADDVPVLLRIIDGLAGRRGPAQALKAVRELHSRRPLLIRGTTMEAWECSHCEDEFPCATIHALDEADA